MGAFLRYKNSKRLVAMVPQTRFCGPHSPMFWHFCNPVSGDMLDYHFKLWKITVLSFAKCGVILHFLSSWGWKWRSLVCPASASLILGLAHICGSNALASRQLAIHTPLLEHSSRWWGGLRLRGPLGWGRAGSHRIIFCLVILVALTGPSPCYTSQRQCKSLHVAVVRQTLILRSGRQRYSQPYKCFTQGSWPPLPDRTLAPTFWGRTPRLPTFGSASPLKRKCVSTCVNFPCLKLKNSNAFSQMEEEVALFSKGSIFYVKRLKT